MLIPDNDPMFWPQVFEAEREFEKQQQTKKQQNARQQSKRRDIRQLPPKSRRSRNERNLY
jgi:hypothetical protein